MAEFSTEIFCPKCYIRINVKLSEIHRGSSTKCPKCGANVKFSDDDLSKVLKELRKIEDTIKKFEE